MENVEVSWNKQSNPTKKSNLSKHIKYNVDHVSNWSVLAKATRIMFEGKTLEANYIVNELVEPEILYIFRNGVM